MDNDQNKSELLNDLAEEFVQRYRQGERPAISEFEQRCPDQAAEIRELFPTLAAMEQASPSETSIANHSTFVAPGTRPQVIGEYRILHEVGRGGMGIVYEAEQVSLGRRVALKVLPQHLLTNEQQKLRFQREARAAAKLHHTNIVPVFGVGEFEGIHYYIMQFIVGCGLDTVLDELRRISEEQGGLDARLPADFAIQPASSNHQQSALELAQTLVGNAADSASDPQGVVHEAEESVQDNSAKTAGSSASVVLPPSTDSSRGVEQATYWHSVARIGLQVAEALDHAHGQGILHRDIKPSNLILDTTGTVWITDFGLAKSDDQDNLTHTGDILGTLRYMAPELFNGIADPRSDVYALGLSLYELLALQPAFYDPDRNRLIKSVMTATPERLERVNQRIPRDLVTIVHKAIDREPHKRYGSAEELAADLRRFLNDEPIQARRVSTLEQFARWARHNKGIATALLIVALLVVTIAVGASLASWRFERLASKNAQLAEDAFQANRTMELALADVYCSHGLLAAGVDSGAAEETDPTIAALWFANAATFSEHDSKRQYANTIRARNWLAASHRPVHARDLEQSFSWVSSPAPGFLLCRVRDTIHAWNWRKQQELSWLDGEQAAAVAFNPDGTLLAISRFSPVAAQASPDANAPANGETGDAEAKSADPGHSDITIYKFPTGEVAHRWQHPGRVEALAFSASAEWLVAANESLNVWDLSSGQAVTPATRKLPHHINRIRFFAADTRLLATDRNHRALVYAFDKELGPADELLFPPLEHHPFTPDLPALVDGERGLITVTGKSGRVEWRDANSGELTKWQRAPSQVGSIRVLSASANGEHFAIGGHDSVQLWQVKDQGRTPRSQILRHKNHITSLSFSVDGGHLATGSWDGFVKMWRTDGQRVGQPMWHQGKVHNAMLLTDTKHLVTIQQGGLLRVWKLADKSDRHFHLEYPGGSLRATLGPCGQFTVPARFDHFGWDYNIRRLRVYDAENGTLQGVELSLAGTMRHASLSPNQQFVAVCCRVPAANNVLQVLRLSDGQTLFPDVELEADPQAVVFDPSGEQLAVYCDNGSITLVEATTGTRIADLQDQQLSGGPSVRRLFYSRDGSQLIAVCPRAIGVWNAATHKLCYPLLKPGGTTTLVALHPTENWLASGTQGNGELVVWDLEIGERLCEPIQHADDIFALCFDTQGGRILTAGRNGQVRLLDWRKGIDLCSPMNHGDEVYGCALTRDGQFGITACRDKNLRIWDLATGKQVCSPLRHGQHGTTSVVVTASGKRAVAARVGFSKQGMLSVDLESLLAAPAQPLSELLRQSELASGHRVVGGNLKRLSQQEWQATWTDED